MQRCKNFLCVLEEEGGSGPGLARAVALARNNRASPAVIDVIPVVTVGLGAPVAPEN